MKLRTLFPLAVLASVSIGCKPADSGATAADNSKAATNSATPAGDSKPAADSSGNSIVGTWTNDDPSSKDVVFAFNPDGTLEVTGSLPVSASAKANADIKATYKVDGGKMTIHFVSINLQAQANADDKTKKLIDAQNKAGASNKPPDSNDTVAFTDKDTFTSTNSKGKVSTFHRKS